MIVYQIKIIQHTGNDQSEALIFDSTLSDDTLMLEEPECKLECGKAGSLSFTVLPTSPFFNSFNKLTTEVILTEDGTEIFRGRVYEVELSIEKKKQITCEGDIAYLSDSIQDPDRTKVDVSETKTVEATAFNAEHKNLQVTGSRPVTCACTKANVSPTIKVNVKMTVDFGGSTYSLNTGVNVVSGIKFVVGDNDLNFHLDASNYSSSSTYAVNDLVYYDNKPFKCIIAVAEAEDFDYNKWELADGRIEYIEYEGSLSEYKATFETTEEKGVKETITAHFVRLINNHNSQVEEWKRFTIGVVTVDDADKVKEFDAANYRDTFTAIDSDIIDYYGGYLRTRRVGNVTYIDLLKEYTTTATQQLAFGENIIDLTDTRNAEDIFTVLIPIGDDDLTIKDVNGGSKMLIDAAGVAKYGKIYKSETFSGIDDAQKLKETAQKYMQREIDLDPCELTVTAYDIRYFNGTVPTIKIGDKVTITCPELELTTTLDCKTKTIKPINPESAEYEFGKQKQSLSYKSKKNNDRTSEGVAGAKSRGGSAGGAAGKIYKTLIETGNNLLIQANELAVHAKEIELNNAKIKFYEDAGISIYNLGKALMDIEEVIMQRARVKGLSVDAYGGIAALDVMGSYYQTGSMTIHGNISQYEGTTTLHKLITPDLTVGYKKATWQKIPLVTGGSLDIGLGAEWDSETGCIYRIWIDHANFNPTTEDSPEILAYTAPASS